MATQETSNGRKIKHLWMVEDVPARGDKDAVTALYRRLERPLFAFLVKTLRDREAAGESLPLLFQSGRPLLVII